MLPPYLLRIAGMVLLIIPFCGFAQLKDSTVQTHFQIKRRLLDMTKNENSSSSKWLETPEGKRYLKLKRLGTSINKKIDFIGAITQAEYYGGGKSGQAITNKALDQVQISNKKVFEVLNSGHSISENLQSLMVVDSILNSLYDNQLKYVYKDKTYDKNLIDLVEVQVTVYESYAGKREVSGVKIFAESPFVANSKEEFNPTPYAQKKISPGWQWFQMKFKNKVYPKELRHIMAKDTNTHHIYLTLDNL